jgi:hypothetical protein
MNALLSFLLLFAQQNTASISGRVLDPTGASVPGATVIAKNAQTGLERSIASDESGTYTLTLLPIGQYDLSAELSGFKKAVKTGIVLQVAQQARFDLVLEVGRQSETVEVTATVPLTQTESSSVGAVIDNRKVVELALNGRNFFQLALLVPQVTPPAEGSILSFRGGFNVGGASELANNFTLDGFDNNNGLLSAPSYRPSVDTIQEFKVLTGSFAAELGHNSGGQVIVTTKSGTNDFHGGLFEFHRNSVLDARNFFFPANIRKPSFIRNQFGANLGGPIWRNKTFFFFSYEGLRLRQQVAGLGTVPLPEMAKGDFRQIPTRVLNPFTGRDFRTPNVIDPELINPIGQALAGFYPLPTSPTPPGRLPSSNFSLGTGRRDHLNQYSIRFDHTISAKDSLMVSLNDFNDETFEVNNVVCGSRVIPGFGCTVGLRPRLAGVTHTHIFGPSLINELRLGFQTFENPRHGEDESIDFLTKYNIPGVRLDGPQFPGVPSTQVQGFASIGSPTNFPQERIDLTYQGADNVTYNRGKNAMKFGFDYRLFQTNRTQVSNGRGSFTFNAQTSALTSGYAMADLLLGLPTFTQRAPFNPRLYNRTSMYAGFVQDDWKVRPNLTLNVGVRYEYFAALYEKYNKLSNFNPANGSVEIQGQDGRPNRFWNPDKNNFEPRIGFSWQPFRSSKTVVRSGFGIYYNVPATNMVSSGPQQNNPPFTSSERFNATRDNPISLTNPFPVANITAGTLTLFGFNRRFQDFQVAQWSLNVQQQLTNAMVIELGYQGSSGTHLPLFYNLNQPPPGAGSVAQQQARRPYPQYGNITWLDTAGKSNYHGMSLRLEHRSERLSYMLSYTWAKSIDDAPGTVFNVSPSRSNSQDRNNLRGERGLSGFDVRQRFVFSPVWRLPLGTNMLARNWEVSSIVTLQSGRPFTTLITRDQSNTLDNLSRPNIIGDVNTGPRAVAEWFNKKAVQEQAFGTFGNAGRNNIIGPPYKNFDFVLSRTISLGHLREGVSMQWRAEFFNAFNHPNFNTPVQTVDNPSFGEITSASDPRQMQFGLKIKF